MKKELKRDFHYSRRTLNICDTNMRSIDADKITPDSELVKSIVALHKECGLRHKEGCLADSCEECLARWFSGAYDHLLPLIPKNQTKK